MFNCSSRRIDSTYNDVKSAVLGYENVAQSCSEKKIFTELGVVQSFGTSGGGTAPMQIDVVTWKDKGSSRPKARTTRKASPRVKDNGMVALAKEKGDWSNPGQGQGGSGGFQGSCDYCHKYGYKKRNCYKLKKDNEKGGGKGQYVRQVEGADERGRNDAGSSSSTSYRSSGDGSSTTSGCQACCKVVDSGYYH